MISKFFPVIHLSSISQGLREAHKAYDAGADGAFFIHHGGDDDMAVEVARLTQTQHPDWYTGINLLASGPCVAFERAIDAGLRAIWADNTGVSSSGLSPRAKVLSRLQRSHPFIDIYAGVAFKYQSVDPAPASTTYNICDEGWIPTTSGSATGTAANVTKIEMLAQASSTGLGLASGVSLENIDLFLPYVTHFFVASSIEMDAHTLDFEKMSALGSRIHGGHAA